VVIIDDHLAIRALGGLPVPTASSDDVVATTWGFHFRLVRALADPRVEGSLTRTTPAALRGTAARPPAGRLVVLDPRDVTGEAARIAVEHGLNLLASELIASAKAHEARIVLTAANVGGRWRTACDAEGVALDVVDV
jgi:hypothetical protein